MRKLSIAVLVVAILFILLFVFFHRLRPELPSITGIGVLLGVRDQALQIMGVVPGTPAANAGLHPGLVIQQIDGTDVVGKPLAVCAAMTRGRVGSKVQIEVVDPTKGVTNIVEFTREKIPVPAGNTLR